MTTPTPPEHQRSVAEIEADLARTRTELADTLDALKERMDPKVRAAMAALGFGYGGRAESYWLGSLYGSGNDTAYSVAVASDGTSRSKGMSSARSPDQRTGTTCAPPTRSAM